jgi:hypothetical protein
MSEWMPLSILLEKGRLRRMAYRSGRREALGLDTNRIMMGMERHGERRDVPQRKRPKVFQSLLNRTPYRAKTTKSRYW